MKENVEENIGKLGPCNQINPEDLPDAAIEGYPIPWKAFGGNGHIYIYDAEGKPVFHVYCWDEEDWNRLNKKMQDINGDDRQYV